MMQSVTYVALGGAIGASLRYLAGLGIVRMLGHTGFPVADLPRGGVRESDVFLPWKDAEVSGICD